ncbi:MULTISPECIES: hypothetical protein [Sphingobacterium]|jgi:hypothetical protein|uniref:hypothetical protein n=1 Tax=Sphingobacterium TaxID=28453 RepID=UPI00257DA7F3|nr:MULTISPECIES: hypothetical protein [Sphingobacterium]MDF2849923.1 hypothetical protein [Sphingobacterium multivorum]
MELKVLFLVFHGFSAHNGISKKIFGQVKGLRECGAEVKLCYYEVLDSGHRAWIVEDEIIADLGKGPWAKSRKRWDFRGLTAYVSSERFDLIYMRSYHNSSPFLINAVRKFRQTGAKVVMEIPTYPYDQEYIRLIDKIMQVPDRFFRKAMASVLDGIVTFTEEEEIFGAKTIKISNGIDLNELPLRVKKTHDEYEIHLLAVAEIHFWHGFDRVIKGLGIYYKGNPTCKVFFNIVGNLSGAREQNEIFSAIEAAGVQEYVFLHGALWGKKLDLMFDQADFAIGSLARHRSGITFIRTLKTREYAARGIPFMYSEVDSDFEDKPYILKAKPDESPIDIRQIVSYCSSVDWEPLSIRNDIYELSWRNQMKKVIDHLNLS